jgi:hypothetical protein
VEDLEVLIDRQASKKREESNLILDKSKEIEPRTTYHKDLVAKIANKRQRERRAKVLKEEFAIRICKTRIIIQIIMAITISKSLSKIRVIIRIHMKGIEVIWSN